jgi:hypothetical protein
MRIGILCEGEKTDEPVLRLLLEHIFPAHEFLIKGVSKAVIFSGGDIELARLFAQGAERVLILWDLLPIGYQMPIAAQWNDRPSRREQRQKLLELLCKSEQLPEHLRRQAHFHAHHYGFPPFHDTPIEHPNGGVHYFRLVCVCYTADGWLLADDGLLTSLASQGGPAPRCTAPHPDECRDPVAFLTKYYKQGRHRRLKYYNKADHNILIATAYRDQDKIKVIKRRSDSFRYLVEAIEGWVQA